MTTKHRSRRRLWLFVIFLLLIGCGYLAHRITVGPRLRPVTVRKLPAGAGLLFSAGGLGYPAIEIGLARSKSPNNGNWLADAGIPMPGSFCLADYPLIGPKREVVRGYQVSGRSYSPRLIWRDGRREPLTATSVFPWGGYHANWFLTDDLRYRVYQYYRWPRPADLPFIVQDRVLKRNLFSFNSDIAPGIVFHHGNRFLIAVAKGRIQVFENGKRLRIFGTKNTVWQWGEDGTVWAVMGTRANVIAWHAGDCRLVAPKVAVPSDPQVSFLSNTDYNNQSTRSIEIIFQVAGGSYYGIIGRPGITYNPSVAVWGDGKVMACTKTIPLWPQMLEPLITSLEKRSVLHNTPRQGRQLILYRNGWRIGSYTVRLDPTVQFPVPAVAFPTPSPIPQVTHEHLAFTGDGRYLAWVIETVKGKTMYVFKVPSR